MVARLQQILRSHVLSLGDNVHNFSDIANFQYMNVARSHLLPISSNAFLLIGIHFKMAYEIVRHGASLSHEPVARYVILRVAHAPGMPVTFSLPPTSQKPLVSDYGMRHARAVMHAGITNPQWRGKSSRHSSACAARNLTYLIIGPSLPPDIPDEVISHGKLKVKAMPYAAV